MVVRLGCFASGGCGFPGLSMAAAARPCEGLAEVCVLRPIWGGGHSEVGRENGCVCEPAPAIACVAPGPLQATSCKETFRQRWTIFRDVSVRLRPTLGPSLPKSTDFGPNLGRTLK